MNKLFIILLICLMCQGCSFLKVISAPLQSVKNSVPQSTEQSKIKTICSKNAVFNEDGLLISCDGKYYNYNQNYEQVDRKLTVGEKIGQFFSKLTGYMLWVIIIGGVLSCMGLGGLFTAFITGATNVGSVGIKGIKQIMQAIQKVKGNDTVLTQALETSTDESVKQWIADYKRKNNIS